MFTPTEIIFSTTTVCNLHCNHCFVSRNNSHIDINDAVSFITKMHNDAPQVNKIGFTGGEPFLYTEFLFEVIKKAVELDFMFDQIMTNGDWWKTLEELQYTLQKLYDAGYDGKIGLSWDTFHGQSEERMKIFINSVHNIFGKDSINIQQVISSQDNSKINFPDNVRVFRLPQTFPGDDERAWKCKKWFKDDYCEGPGHIFYVHTDGNIAPCCGFANENPALFIGTIKDDYNKLMENAYSNNMIQICYIKGLGKYKKSLKKDLKKQGTSYPGKCNDICSFCDFVCKNSI